MPDVAADVDAVGDMVSTGRTGDAPNAEHLARCGFSAEAGEIVTLLGADGAVPVVAGLGDTADPHAVRQAAAGIARAVRRWKRTAIRLPEPTAARAVVEAFMLALYQFDRYRAAAEPVAVERLDIVSNDSDPVRAALAAAQRLARATALARDLVNEPGGTLTPTVFAERAVELAGEAGLSCTVWDERRIAAERLGGLLGVSRGSAEPPRLVRVEYEPVSPVASVALVGKGVTFDAGGLTLKNPKQLLDMKQDMAGAATVLAAVTALPDLGGRVRTVAWLPLTENMPSGSAIRVGDVLRMRTGTTVEVRNTDAEGRLILADALALAAEERPDAIVDVATLTDASPVAVGTKMASVLGNREWLVDSLRAAADRAGELVWPLPLHAGYRKQLDSTIADIANVTGNRHGGAITAALFLNEFVPADLPWAHLDIYGPAFCDADDGEWTAGGTGFGVRTLAELLVQPEHVQAAVHVRGEDQPTVQHHPPDP